MSLPMLCNMGLWAAFVGCDVGFAGNATAELFALDPSGDTLPTHAWSLAMTTARHEPWFGDRVRTHLPRIECATYRPYLYTLLGKQLQLVHRFYAHYYIISQTIPALTHSTTSITRPVTNGTDLSTWN